MYKSCVSKYHNFEIPGKEEVNGSRINVKPLRLEEFKTPGIAQYV